jgi:predicted nicotinamide N-methyase
MPPVPPAPDPIPALADPAAFIAANTERLTAPLVPEVKLHLATEVVPLWQMTEAELDRSGLPPPFWAFAWAGGQALARYVLDHPETVRGKRVLDFAAGCGIVGIAAKLAGARDVLCADIDPLAAAACRLNAEANGVTLEASDDDLVGVRGRDWDTVLAGDICYEQPLSTRVEAWLKTLAQDGATVLVGDPGRTYLPKGLEKITAYAVRTTRELEDTDVRNACVWRVA